MLTHIGSLILYCMAQNFGSRKHWQIAVNKHYGRQGFSTLHSKIARIKIVAGQNYGGLVSNR